MSSLYNCNCDQSLWALDLIAGMQRMLEVGYEDYQETRDHTELALLVECVAAVLKEAIIQNAKLDRSTINLSTDVDDEGMVVS